MVQEDFKISFITDLCSSTEDQKIIADVLSEVLHSASNRLVND